MAQRAVPVGLRAAEAAATTVGWKAALRVVKVVDLVEGTMVVGTEVAMMEDATRRNESNEANTSETSKHGSITLPDGPALPDGRLAVRGALRAGSVR